MAYNPSDHFITAKPLSITKTGIDARSMFKDITSTPPKYRPYASIAEVLEYLSHPNPDVQREIREGHFSVFIKTGGVTDEWWFKNGTADSDLKIKTNDFIGSYYTKTEIDGFLATINENVTDVTEAFNAHASDTGNPHNVTLPQLGLSNTDNLVEGQLNLYYTNERVKLFGDTQWVSLTGAYNDPSWIISLSYDKITGRPPLAIIDPIPIDGSTNAVQSNGVYDALQLKIDLSQKASPLGVATLDGAGKVPLSQINDSILGAVNYKGTYNAATNTPALPAISSNNKGWYYIINTPGVVGGKSYALGDWIISNGISWDKVDNNNLVTSVNGRLGAVVIVKADVGLGNADNTSDVNKPLSTPQKTYIDNNFVDKTTDQTVNGFKIWTQPQTFRQRLELYNQPTPANPTYVRWDGIQTNVGNTASVLTFPRERTGTFALVEDLGNLDEYLKRSGGLMTGQDIYWNYDNSNITIPGFFNPAANAGITFVKNTDYGKMYFESNGSEDGTSNLIFENGNDVVAPGGGKEGFIFRKWDFGTAASIDIFKINIDELKYKTFDVFHAGNRRTNLQDDVLFVGLTNDQTISGNKRFSKQLIGSAGAEFNGFVSLSYPSAQFLLRENNSGSSREWVRLGGTPNSNVSTLGYVELITASGQANSGNPATSYGQRITANPNVAASNIENTLPLTSGRLLNQNDIVGFVTLAGFNTFTGSNSFAGLTVNSPANSRKYAEFNTLNYNGATGTISGQLSLFNDKNDGTGVRYSGTIVPVAVLTDNRRYQLPDKSGVLVVNTDIDGKANLNGGNTFTGSQVIDGGGLTLNAGGVTAGAFTLPNPAGGQPLVSLSQGSYPTVGGQSPYGGLFVLTGKPTQASTTYATNRLYYNPATNIESKNYMPAVDGTLLNENTVTAALGGETLQAVTARGAQTTVPISIGNVTSPNSFFNIRESANGVGQSAMSISNRNETRKWSIFVDATTVDDGKFAISDNAGGIRWAIDQLGNVGIGTSSPAAKLDVNGEIRTTRVRTFGTEAVSLMGSDSYIAGYTDTVGTNRNGFLQFAEGVTTLASERGNTVVRLNGNVGINTSTPLAVLTVGGQASGPTATPSAISLDPSYSNTGPGAMVGTRLKLYLYNNGNDQYGFGIDGNAAISYWAGSLGNSGNHTFYTNGAVRASITSAGINSTAFNITSKRSSKENIQDYTDNAIDAINKISIKSFNYKNDEEKGFKVGFIADDTDALFATKEHDKLDIGSTVGVLLKAVQELSAEIKLLKSN